MNTHKKILVKKSEIADMLGWEYQTVASILRRRKPEHKYELIKACERKIHRAKQHAHETFLKSLNA